MADVSQMTAHISIAFGLYALAAGLGMVLDPERIRRMMHELESSAALSFLTGVLVFVIGAAIVMVHPMGTHWFSILITVIGWAAVIEGLVFLAKPDLITNLARRMMSMETAIWGGVAMIIGIAMIVAGWIFCR